MEMSLPETVGQAMSWGNDIYSQYADLKISMGGRDPGVQIQVQDNSQGSTAQALVVFSREGGHREGRIVMPDLDAPKPTRSAKDSIEIVLFWAPDTWGTWRLDAKRTAENAVRSFVRPAKVVPGEEVASLPSGVHQAGVQAAVTSSVPPALDGRIV